MRGYGTRIAGGAWEEQLPRTSHCLNACGFGSAMCSAEVEELAIVRDDGVLGVGQTEYKTWLKRCRFQDQHEPHHVRDKCCRDAFAGRCCLLMPQLP